MNHNKKKEAKAVTQRDRERRRKKLLLICELHSTGLGHLTGQSFLSFKDQTRLHLVLPEPKSSKTFCNDGNVPYLHHPIREPLITWGY